MRISIRTLRYPIALLTLALACVADNGQSPTVPTGDGLGIDRQPITTGFAAGSLIIPMESTYQDSTMLKAYGLVTALTTQGIPVSWAIATGKAVNGTDFTASAVDINTNATISNHAYIGGPFIIDQADVAAATSIITTWNTPTVKTTVHRATASFMADVQERMAFRAAHRHRRGRLRRHRVRLPERRRHPRLRRQCLAERRPRQLRRPPGRGDAHADSERHPAERGQYAALHEPHVDALQPCAARRGGAGRAQLARLDPAHARGDGVHRGHGIREQRELRLLPHHQGLHDKRRPTGHRDIPRAGRPLDQFQKSFATTGNMLNAIDLAAGSPSSRASRCWRQAPLPTPR